MTFDTRYVAAFNIETVILDKDSGAPLSGGIVTFEDSLQAGVLKNVWQVTNTSGTYTYTQLPNPMTLSSVGTFVDTLDNPVIPYFLAYDEDGDQEYYRVIVQSSGSVAQFTRDPVPFAPDDTGSGAVASAFENEISNPQFAEVVFDTSTSTYVYNFNIAAAEVVNIAPDWDIIVSSAGVATVTVTQENPVGSLNIVTNPGTYLTIESSGASSLVLRQRILGSPNLWGSQFLSGTFVAKTFGGSAQTLDMTYSQSDGTVIDKVITSGTLNGDGSFAAHPGSIEIIASDSTQANPTAYIDIKFVLTSLTKIGLTSIMAVPTAQTSVAAITYDEASLNRQIDHLYHDAYPIIPVGAIIDFGGFTVPAHYFLCDGTPKNRITYQRLFRVLTTTEDVALTNTVNTFTVVSAANYYIGMAIEGTGISASTTIANIVGTTITMSAVATATVTSTVTFYAWGAGDGSTTFNMPDLREYVTAGANGSLFGSGLNAVGYRGGAPSYVLQANDLPPHTHPVADGPVGGVGATSRLSTGTGASTTGSNVTTNTAVSLVQRTANVFKYIRYE